jgi:hypothetical protein
MMIQKKLCLAVNATAIMEHHVNGLKKVKEISAFIQNKIVNLEEDLFNDDIVVVTFAAFNSSFCIEVVYMCFKEVY